VTVDGKPVIYRVAEHHIAVGDVSRGLHLDLAVDADLVGAGFIGHAAAHCLRLQNGMSHDIFDPDAARSVAQPEKILQRRNGNGKTHAEGDIGRPDSLLVEIAEIERVSF